MSLLGSVIQGVISAQQAEQAKKELDKLPEYKMYEPQTELTGYYEMLTKLSRDPYSAESDAAFSQAMAQGSRGAYQRGLSADPSVSGSLLSAINTSGMAQQTQRQLSGDQLRANYVNQLGSISQNFQNMYNMNISDYNSRLMAREQALGQALATAKENAADAWIQFGDESERKSAKIVTGIAGGAMGGGMGAGISGMTGGGGGEDPYTTTRTGSGSAGSYYSYQGNQSNNPNTINLAPSQDDWSYGQLYGNW